jgi:hypothetical protein
MIKDKIHANVYVATPSYGAVVATEYLVGPAEVREALLGLALQLVGWSQNSQNEYRSD